MKLPLILLLILASFSGLSLSGCVAAIGAGGAVAVDSALENERGGDGLF
ncbi:MAG: hypothetical protein AAFY59_02295 [Pseudomonadota bacterium]